MTPAQSVRHATPAEIQKRLELGEQLLLVDVREQEEIAIAFIKGALVRPMSQAGLWIDTLPREGEMVVFCHHGIRSMHVAVALAERGHTNVTNMTGGIDLWSAQVDDGVPRY